MTHSRNKWRRIVKILTEKKLTIATMESCTGGGVANKITNVSGASSVIKESYITYCNEAKIKHGVSEAVIEKYSVYSEETAIAMARAAKENANSDVGIGVTGQLGRIDSSNPVDKLNCVWFAIMNQNNELAVEMVKVPDGDRLVQKEVVLKAISRALLNVL